MPNLPDNTIHSVTDGDDDDIVFLEEVNIEAGDPAELPIKKETESPTHNVALFDTDLDHDHVDVPDELMENCIRKNDSGLNNKNTAVKHGKREPSPIFDPVNFQLREDIIINCKSESLNSDDSSICGSPTWSPDDVDAFSSVTTLPPLPKHENKWLHDKQVQETVDNPISHSVLTSKKEFISDDFCDQPAEPLFSIDFLKGEQSEPCSIQSNKSDGSNTLSANQHNKKNQPIHCSVMNDPKTLLQNKLEQQQQLDTYLAGALKSPYSSVASSDIYNLESSSDAENIVSACDNGDISLNDATPVKRNLQLSQASTCKVASKDEQEVNKKNDVDASVSPVSSITAACLSFVPFVSSSKNVIFECPLIPQLLELKAHKKKFESQTIKIHSNIPHNVNAKNLSSLKQCSDMQGKCTEIDTILKDNLTQKQGCTEIATTSHPHPVNIVAPLQAALKAGCTSAVADRDIFPGKASSVTPSKQVSLSSSQNIACDNNLGYAAKVIRDTLKDCVSSSSKLVQPVRPTVNCTAVDKSNGSSVPAPTGVAASIHFVKALVDYTKKHPCSPLPKNQRYRCVVVVGDERYRQFMNCGLPRWRHPLHVMAREGLTMPSLESMVRGFVLEHLTTTVGRRGRLLLVCTLGWRDLLQVTDVPNGRKKVHLPHHRDDFLLNVLHDIMTVCTHLRAALAPPVLANVVFNHVWPVNAALHEEFINRKSPFLLSMKDRDDLEDLTRFLNQSIREINVHLSARRLTVPESLPSELVLSSGHHWNASFKPSLSLVNGILPRGQHALLVRNRMSELYDLYVKETENYVNFGLFFIIGDERLACLEKFWPQSSKISPILILSDNITGDNLMEVVNHNCSYNDLVLFCPSVRGVLKTTVCSDCSECSHPLHYPTFDKDQVEIDEWVSKLMRAVQQKRSQDWYANLTLVMSNVLPYNLQQEVSELVDRHHNRYGHLLHRVSEKAHEQEDQLKEFTNALNERLKDACVISNTPFADNVFHSIQKPNSSRVKKDDGLLLTRTILDSLTGYMITCDKKRVTYSGIAYKGPAPSMLLRVVDLYCNQRTAEDKKLSSVVVGSSRGSVDEESRHSSKSTGFDKSKFTSAKSRNYRSRKRSTSSDAKDKRDVSTKHGDSTERSDPYYVSRHDGSVEANVKPETCHPMVKSLVCQEYCSDDRHHSRERGSDSHRFKSKRCHSRSPSLSEKTSLSSSGCRVKDQPEAASETHKRKQKKKLRPQKERQTTSEESLGSCASDIISNLQKTHMDEWERYEIQPSLHPSYNSELSRFLTLSTIRDMSDAGAREKDVMKLWHPHWAQRMREIQDEAWDRKVADYQKTLTKELKKREQSATRLRNKKRKKRVSSSFSETSLSDDSSENEHKKIVKAKQGIRVYKTGRRESDGDHVLETCEMQKNVPSCSSDVSKAIKSEIISSVDPKIVTKLESSSGIDKSSPATNIIQVSAVLKLAIHLKSHIGLLASALPLILAKVTDEAEKGSNVLDAITPDDLTLLSLVQYKLERVHDSFTGPYVEKIVLQNCREKITALVEAVQENVKLGLKKMAVDTMFMDQDSMLACVTEHLTKVNSKQSIVTVFNNLIKERDRIDRFQKQNSSVFGMMKRN